VSPPRQVGDDGLWQAYSSAARAAPALFLDRDGVLVEGVDYLHEVEKTRLISGAGQVIATARAKGYHIVVVTNQSGIGRGYYGWDDFAAVQEQIDQELRREDPDAWVDGVLACPFAPKGTGPLVDPDHPGRKPNSGMLLAAAQHLGIQLDQSWIVGDTIADLLAGRAAGIKGGIHVLSGHGQDHRTEARALAAPGFEIHLADTIADCLTLPPLIVG
jgi:D-glycero-D-manno-heptose 1,7-bisphosphate phosphatase